MNRWYQADQDSVNTAYDNGALVVASAGNDGSEAYHYPASFDNVLSVAATTSSGDHAYFSQYNCKIDIALPGVAIEITTLNGGYTKASGTSFSAPQVSGSIARVWSVCPQCSNADVKRCHLSSTTTTPKKERTSSGLAW
jgi:serine protease